MTVSDKEKTASRAATRKAVNEEKAKKLTSSIQLYNNFPQELKNFPNWLVRKGKVPYSPVTGKKANNVQHCASFDKALARVEWGKYDGLGFHFEGTPYTGIDIDHCINEKGEWRELAAQALSDFNSYTEYSPSGTGIHIIVKGKIPASIKNSKHGIEIYSIGRYFTMTGNKVPHAAAHVADCQDVLNLYYDTFSGSGRGDISTIGKLITIEPVYDKETVQNIISLARSHDKSGKFKDLFDAGDLSTYNGDHSSADMALLCILAYWTNCEPQLMHDVFNESALARRPKWQEGNSGNPLYYRERSIRNAIIFHNQKEVEKIREALDLESTDSKPIATNIQLYYRQSGKAAIIAPEVPENTEYFLCALGITIRYNEITSEIEYTGTVKGQNLKTSKDPVPLLRGAFIQMKDFKINRSDLEDALSQTAQKYKYNPIQDYLNECKQLHGATKGQLELFFSQFILDETASDKELSFLLFKKWFIGAAIMAFNDGSKSTQGVLVLKGPQGIGKTRFLYKLLPDTLLKYVKEGVVISKGSRDDKMHIMRKMFIELGEVGYSLRNTDIDALKNIITESTDEIRKPYARSFESAPRMCSFIATVNDDKFLKDDTGERRWWIIALNGLKPLPPEFDINKMWGEIMTLAFTEKVPYWLTPDEMERLNNHNMQFKTETNEEQLLKDVLDWFAPVEAWQRVTATALAEQLGLNPNNHGTVIKIGHALKRMINSNVFPYSQIKAPSNNKNRCYTVPFRKGRMNFDDAEEWSILGTCKRS